MERFVNMAWVSRFWIAAVVFGMAAWSIAVRSSAQSQPPAAGTTPSTATNAPAIPAAQKETLEGLEKKLAELEMAQVDDAVKTKAREYYQQARTELEQVALFEPQLADFRNRIATATERLDQQTTLETQGDKPLLDPPDNADLTELEKTLAERQAEVKRLDELVKRLEAEPQRRGNRRLEIPKTLATLKEQIVEVENGLAAPPDPSEPPVVAQARRTLLVAKWQARTTQSETLTAELAAYDAEKDLPNRERVQLRNRLTQLTESVENLTALINERRNDEVERRHQQVVREYERTLESFETNVDRAKLNLEMSNETRRLARDVSAATTALTALEKELSDWKTRIEKSERRVEKGASASTVAALRIDRINARDRIDQLRRDLAQREAKISDLQDRLVELQDLSDEYANLEARVDEMARERGFANSPEEEQALEANLRNLLSTYQELIDDQSVRTNQYFEKLVELNDTADDLRRELDAYLTFINERILWMRSSSVISLGTFRDAARQLVSVPISFDGWMQWANRAGAGLWYEATTQKMLSVTFVLVFLIVLRYQRHLRSISASLGDVAGKGNCVRFLPTLEEVLIALLIALPWALLMFYAGWRLSVHGLAVGQALLVTASIFFPLEVFRQMCRRKGLAESHFGWSDRVLAPLRRNLRWFLVTATPLIVVAASMHAEANSEYDDSTGRIAFIALMVVTAWLVQRVLRPKGGVFQEYLSFHADGWADRLTFFWYPASFLMPLALAVLAGVGFYYSAWDLSLRFYLTVLVILLIVVLGALLHRLLLVSRRRLAIKQARERQQRLQEESGPSETKKPAEAPVDLAAINQQTRRLIQSLLVLLGLTLVWVIWDDVLPALAVLTDIEIYKTEGLEPGVLDRVTLMDLGVAVIALVMTSIAARNIPGLIEIVLLQKLPLDSSVRYAITTVSRYLILVAGVIVVSSTLGFSWKRAQWLVAALGVGLGFGLQEIFANFVSGIILLFERPIRVGDVITLGDVTGAVTRIRIRATTVRDWDGKELIVPNKDLITGRLLNWTLTDTNTRLVVNVGVAYGSDVAQACRLIMEAVAENPMILREPPASVTFESFGDSSLLLVLRAFLPRLDQRLPCMHYLHNAINDKFQRHGIEIAFPQMDIHVRDFAPLAVQRPPNGASEATS